MFALPPPSANERVDNIRLADWIEINLVVDNEPAISVADLMSNLAAEPPDTADESETREQYWDNAERLADDALGELSHRARWLTTSYPIVLDGDVAMLREDVQHLELWRFVTLLRARQMYPAVFAGDANEAGLLFEELATLALGAYAGSQSARSVRFGLAGGARESSLPSQIGDAITTLSARMGERVGALPARNDRDYGADVIAWRPFGDHRAGQLVIIGQATISEAKWTGKEPALRWTESKTGSDRPIDFLARPLTAVVFVEALSLTSNDTIRGLTRNFSSIPFDRFRIMSVLNGVDVPTAFREDIARWVEGVLGEVRP